MGIKIRKILGVTLMLTALVATQFPSVGATDSTTDFQLNGTILVKYTGTDETVSVSDTVTEIGPEAFSDNSYVKNIILPDSITKIDYNAFSNCSALETITLPDELESIGDSAFSGCTSLTGITFGENLSQFGTGVFADCTNLANVTIDSANSSFTIINDVIYNLDKTKVYEMLETSTIQEFSIPSSVTDIAQYAFWGCDNLISVSLSSSMNNVPAYTFTNCQNLETVQFPYSITKIWEYAFAECINLGTISIPEAVSYIHETAFDGCYKLNIQATEGTTAYEFAQQFMEDNADAIAQQDAENVVLDTSDSSTENEDETVYEIDTQTESGTLLGMTRIVSENAVVFIDNTEQTVYSSENGNLGDSDVNDNTENTTVQSDLNTTDTNTSTQDQKGAYIPKFTIFNNHIVDYAYYLNSDLKEYEIEEGIESIDDFAFARTGLIAIEIPDTITHIGYGAFYHCDDLELVTIPDTVTEIEPYAFTYTKYLTDWEASDSSSDFLIVGDGFLLAYKGDLEKVNVPSGVKYIGGQVFKGHEEIKSLVLPDSVITVGEEAFMNCVNLRTVIGGGYIQELKDRCFMNTSISTIRVPSDVEKIGLAAYAGIATNMESDENNVLIFYGEDIPEVSYEKNATRYDNTSYRVSALDTVEAVIVNDKEMLDTTNKNNILFNEDYGYEGLIGIISEDAVNGRSGAVNILYCTDPSYAANTKDYPDTLIIYGEEYQLNYDQMEVYSNTLTAKEESNQGYVIQVTNNSDLFPETDKIDVSISNLNSDYELILENVDLTQDSLLAAYQNLYEMDAIPDNYMTFALNFYDASQTIPILHMGSDTLYVSLPVSIEMAASVIHAITLDDDGQMEELETATTYYEDYALVTMSVDHFSQFALYTSGQEQNTTLNYGSGTLTSLTSIKDDSPDTGDFKINSKWFFISGLFITGIIMAFYKGKRRIEI